MTFYLHVGAPKTASTTLQGRFFPAHPGIFFLGKEESTLTAIKRWAIPEIHKIGSDISRANLDFKLDPDTLNIALNYIRQNHGGRPIVYSYEDICAFNGPSPFEKFARFAKIFAEFKPIKVIMGVRDQIELLKSAYITIHRAEAMHIGGDKLGWYPTFDQYIDINFKYACRAYLESFRFSIILDHYVNAIGRENVFIYSFDDMRRDPAGVLRAMCSFIGVSDCVPCVEQAAIIKENQRHSSRRYAYLQFRWLVLGRRSVSGMIPAGVKSRFWRWIDSGAQFDFSPSQAVTRRLKDYYSADNEILASKYGIRL
jgi:hypothetical protein